VVHLLPSWRGLDASPWPPGAEDDAVARLLDMAERAAPDVAAHMRRTARLARLFSVEVEMPHGLLKLVVRTAQLHDIGKLAIAPWVIEKPGPLSDSERRLIEAHPAMGQKILERRPALTALGPLVRSTHERWDGEGYPDRLSGGAIPLPSRIVAICDAFDAMTSDRAYSRPMTIGGALEELTCARGTQFDPGATEMFCTILEDGIDRWAVGA